MSCYFCMADLKKLVIEEFSSANAQALYRKRAEEGLWSAEAHFINKYFTKSGAKLLDVGCGTGRTTMPFVQMGFDVIGVDLVPAMIYTAKEIAQEKSIEIDYRVDDATELSFENNTFDYAFFSNQGWAQTPGAENRLRVLKEVRRTLKPGGIFIFTAHPRVWAFEFFFTWIWLWSKFYLLKPLGVQIKELDFGDRFFDRENYREKKIYNKKQYIHIPTVEEVRAQIKQAGFHLLESNGSMPVSQQDIKKHPPVFYVCQK